MRFVFGLILGMAVGVSAGLLLAPQRGSETVRVLRERVQEWRGEADSGESEPAEA
jgi:gas vesicle protein